MQPTEKSGLQYLFTDLPFVAWHSHFSGKTFQIFFTGVDSAKAEKIKRILAGRVSRIHCKYDNYSEMTFISYTTF